MKTTCTLFLVAATAALFTSCASTYVTPGGKANLATFSDPDLKKAYTAKPTITFPASLAMVRVQQSGYRSKSTEGHGTGQYSVVTARDAEREEDIQKLTALPGVDQVGTLNRLLLPDSLGSDLELRTAAARLRADAILLYTMDTRYDNGDLVPPLSVITMGLAPTKTYDVKATASALLMDARTGFIYGAVEETDSRSGIATAWGDGKRMEAARKNAEREALEKLLDRFEGLWEVVHERYG